MKNLLSSIILLSTICISTAQNGKLISKELVDLSKEPFWPKIAKNDTIIPKFRYLDSVNIFKIRYLSDSIVVSGFLCQPKKMGKYPVILFNRGGNREHGKNTVLSMTVFGSRLAARGYVMLATNYRGVDGAQGKDEFGGNDINDILNLVETSKTLEKADSTRIGLFGWSRGGMMTYLALKTSSIFKTAVIGNGPSNMFKVAEERPEMEKKVFAECIPNYWKNRDKELTKRSAIKWVDSLPKNTSILLLCGTRDKKVNPQHSRNMAEKLIELDYNCQIKELDTNHKFGDKQKELFVILNNWFKLHL